MNLLTTEDVARILGVTTRTLARYRAEGTGPRWSRIGGALVRYDERDLLEYVAERRLKGEDN
jgi:predicted DNA-binding transcriptional regulator AlpA